MRHSKYFETLCTHESKVQSEPSPGSGGAAMPDYNSSARIHHHLNLRIRKPLKSDSIPWSIEATHMSCPTATPSPVSACVLSPEPEMRKATSLARPKECCMWTEIGINYVYILYMKYSLSRKCEISPPFTGLIPLNLRICAHNSWSLCSFWPNTATSITRNQRKRIWIRLKRTKATTKAPWQLRKELRNFSP